ncbi:MAG: heparan-alpha-glucosaminide N-acetyltransferase domain-containing protein, partial [Planctomycetota bacterium]
MPPSLSETPVTRQRFQSIDWTRGLVMVLMALDHAGFYFDSLHRGLESAAFSPETSELPIASRVARLLSHLCAPTFAFLAGASIGLRGQRTDDGLDRYLITRGLLLILLDAVWISAVPWLAGGTYSYE